MAEIRTSPLFWKLFPSFTDALQNAEGNGQQELRVYLVMVGRMCLTGSARGGNPLDGSVFEDACE